MPAFPPHLSHLGAQEPLHKGSSLIGHAVLLHPPVTREEKGSTLWVFISEINLIHASDPS